MSKPEEDFVGKVTELSHAPLQPDTYAMSVCLNPETKEQNVVLTFARRGCPDLNIALAFETARELGNAMSLVERMPDARVEEVISKGPDIKPKADVLDKLIKGLVFERLAKDLSPEAKAELRKLIG